MSSGIPPPPPPPPHRSPPPRRWETWQIVLLVLGIVLGSLVLLFGICVALVTQS